MRARPAVLLVLAALFTSLFVAASPLARADYVLAQETEAEDSGSEGEGDSEGSGSSEAEVGADEGQTDAAEEETGPPWTYQMSRMILAILVLMALAIGLLYWRLVVQRQRRGI